MGRTEILPLVAHATPDVSLSDLSLSRESPPGLLTPPTSPPAPTTTRTATLLGPRPAGLLLAARGPRKPSLMVVALSLSACRHCRLIIGSAASCRHRPRPRLPGRTGGTGALVDGGPPGQDYVGVSGGRIRGSRHPPAPPYGTRAPDGLDRPGPGNGRIRVACLGGGSGGIGRRRTARSHR